MKEKNEMISLKLTRGREVMKRESQDSIFSEITDVIKITTREGGDRNVHIYLKSGRLIAGSKSVSGEIESVRIASVIHVACKSGEGTESSPVGFVHYFFECNGTFISEVADQQIGWSFSDGFTD